MPRSLFLLALVFGAVPAAAQSVPAPWPRDYKIDNWSIRLHQPQVESWQGDSLVARAAIAITPPGTNARARYGVVWLNAQTIVDRENRRVELHQLGVQRLYMASLPDSGKVWGDSLKSRVARVDRIVGLDALEQSLALTRAEAGETAPAADQLVSTTAVRNEPPEILVSQAPTLLVQVDGEPAWRDMTGTVYQRLLNTRVLILRDGSADGNMYLRFAGGWMVSEGLQGNWLRTEEEMPEAFATFMTAAAEQGTDLMDSVSASLGDAVAAGQDIKVVVSTRPTELLETWGEPVLEPITGTNLLWVNNTASDLFVDVASSDWLVLLSGRWYRAPAAEGPWRFLPYDSLPGDFTLIPSTHEKAAVLAAIPGTPQANEAVVANNTPQMATVSRAVATTTPFFDGEPQLKPIEGTQMQYVVNSPGPVIQVTPTTFFTVDAGVWFVSNAVKGPYQVADKVAPEIYAIPASSPLYYVTFVKVYASNDTSVTVGYTGGYQGAMTSSSNVVVYGTGYAYPPYTGSYWYGYPPTYGMGMRVGFVVGVGWGMAIGWGAPPYYRHGGSVVVVHGGNNYYRGGNVYNRPGTGTRPGAGGAGVATRPANASRGNVWSGNRGKTAATVGAYDRSSGKFNPTSARQNQARASTRPTVGQTRGANGMTPVGRNSQPRSAAPRDNVYGSANGSVWRDNSRGGGGNSWQQMNGGGNRAGASTRPTTPPRDVSRERTARGRAEYRAPSRSSGSRGGGMRGGGGRRR